MRKLGLAIAGMMTALAATPAAAATDLFVFGDSLVDTGNADAGLRATGQATRTPDTDGYFQNRFSDGYNFADVLSMRLGLGASDAYGYPLYLPRAPGVLPTQYFYGGNNFAVGGALAVDKGTVPFDNPPSFQDQRTFFGLSGKAIGADDYVLVTFGGNDLQQLLLTKGGTAKASDLAATNSALTDGLNTLIASGARNIIVTGQADVGLIPRLDGTGLEGLASALSKQLNDSVRTRTQDAAKATGFNIQFFDLFGYEHYLLDAPLQRGGFTNVEDPCLDEAAHTLADPKCAGYLYFDRIHPTARAHQLIGTAIFSQLNGVPEPSTWATMLVGFALVGMAARRRRPVATTA